MNIQEREELEYSPQSESWNCFHEARGYVAERNSETAGRVNALVAAGLYVVVSSYPYHCRATDAFVGMLNCVVSTFATRWLAEREAARVNANVDDGDGGGPSWVLPVAR